MALTSNDLKPKVFFIFEGQPWVVLESHHLKMQQRRPVVQTRMRNLINGKIVDRNFQQSDNFEEADIARKTVKFIYANKGEFWFTELKDASKRFRLTDNVLGDSGKFLKTNIEVEAVMFSGDIINIELPIKIDYKVTEAPPAIRGDTAQGGVKQVVIETGATVNAPLFINEGDTIRINTETGEYAERVNKSN